MDLVLVKSGLLSNFDELWMVHCLALVVSAFAVRVKSGDGRRQVTSATPLVVVRTSCVPPCAVGSGLTAIVFCALLVLSGVSDASHVASIVA